MTFLAHSESAESRIVDLLNVRYVITPSHLNLPKVYEGKRAKVYENLDYLPRAWLVTQTTVANYPDELMSRLLSPSFDPRAEALIEDESGAKSSVNEAKNQVPDSSDSTRKLPDVNFQQLSPTSFVVNLQTDQEARFLVVSENWYPGWVANINGMDEKVKCVNGTLMGVWVPPSQVRVEFFYRPTYIWPASIFTFLSVLCLVLCYLSIPASLERDPVSIGRE